ncbi:MAG TPA: hypothetical protein VGZ47_01745, partial [Gemmataceae bacterium]|nr:hypothetical protein [Gemmataceae bacterium]
FLQFTPLPPDHSQNQLKGLEAPVLTESYQKAAANVAQKRMVLAGYRLAEQLKPALKAGSK